MATIVENITTIKNSIDRMKEALNLPSNTSLEDLTLAVEDGGGSVEKSNIYKAKTIAERDTIADMVEGDMCVVQESTIANLTATIEFQTAICPATVVLPTALTDYVDLRFNAVDTSKMFDCWGMLDSNQFMMDCYTETGSVRIGYTSNDGITYTRIEPTEDTVDFGTPIVYSYPDSWNDVIGYFLQAGNVNFEGIFEYKDSAWKYANINVNIEQNDLLLGKRIYTSNGFVDGNLASDVNEDTLKKVNNIMVAISETPLQSDLNSLFAGSSSISLPITKILDTTQVTKTHYMFSGCSNLTELDLSNFNTDNVVAMDYMFSGCESLTELDLSNFNTGNVISMHYTFSGCKSLTKLDLSNFDTSKVRNMEAMFSNCASLTGLDLSSFNTSSVTVMSNMFNRCTSLTELDLSSFNTSNVTTMMNMFNGCTISKLDLSNFNTGNVTTMYVMFKDCTNLTELDLSSFTSADSLDTRSMFIRCTSLKKLDMRNFDFTKVNSYDSMFTDVPADCLIIVKDTTSKNWITSKFTTLTNVKTVAEYNG